jgi:hypothetical protein
VKLAPNKNDFLKKIDKKTHLGECVAAAIVAINERIEFEQSSGGGGGATPSCSPGIAAGGGGGATCRSSKTSNAEQDGSASRISHNMRAAGA